MAAQKSNIEEPQADQISFEALNKDLLYLESIRDCLERIAEYTAAGKQAFLDPLLIQDGVIRNLEVIGEATKNLSSELREENPVIPWRQISESRQGLENCWKWFTTPYSSCEHPSGPMNSSVPVLIWGTRQYWLFT